MIGRPVTFALYSKLVPSEYQGKYLGWMVAGGSAARTLGPLMAVYLYYHIKGPWKNTFFLFGSEGVIMVICLVLVILLWPHLLPTSKSQTVEDIICESLRGSRGRKTDCLSTHWGSSVGDLS